MYFFGDFLWASFFQKYQTAKDKCFVDLDVQNQPEKVEKGGGFFALESISKTTIW